MDKSVNTNGMDVRIQGKILRIGRLELDKYEYLDDPQALIEALKKCGRRIDVFTFLQRVPDTTPRLDCRIEWDNLAVLPVTTFDQWWNHQIRSYPRNRARQAEKRGVTIREVPFDDKLVRGIWEIYNESAVRQGVKFSHYGRDIEWVRQHAGTFLDRSIFIGAFLDSSLIGFIKLVGDKTWSQVNMMHIVSMMQHREKAPTNALIAQAVRSCAERNIGRLVYQNFSYGKEDDTLSHFKEVNGFQRIDLPRYYVPLTTLGRTALGLGLHRRLADQLPKSVGAKLRELRKAWYRRKFRSEAEA